MEGSGRSEREREKEKRERDEEVVAWWRMRLKSSAAGGRGHKANLKVLPPPT